uniref:Uncharacterized protein n=1 Tax=Arundo donax TaxID=35708 RepID=A0A0A8ZXY3_ARUDO
MRTKRMKRRSNWELVIWQ